MSSTLLLDVSAWDLVVDAAGNIAVATEPYSLAQDAASAIKTFLGECFWDTTIGVPYMTDILGKQPPLALLKAEFIAAAKTVPGIGAAQCFVSSVAERGIGGQVQVTAKATGQVAAADFVVVSPQGIG